MDWGWGLHLEWWVFGWRVWMLDGKEGGCGGWCRPVGRVQIVRWYFRLADMRRSGRAGGSCRVSRDLGGGKVLVTV